jgi:hypothetical protein
MEELYWRTFWLSNREFEWLAVVALFVIGGVYLLVPALGYSVRGRGLFIAAMGLLLLKIFFAFIRLGFWQYDHFDKIVNTPSTTPPWGGGGGGSTTKNNVSANIVVQIFMPVIEAGIFLLAMLLFCIGLMTLSRAPKDRLSIVRRDEDL